MLLVVVQFHLRDDGQGLRVANATWPDVSDLGLADGSGEQIGQRPPRPADPPYAKAGFCQDRLFYVKVGPTRSLASVEVKEEFVYDAKDRGSIAFVGVGVTLTLGEDSLRAYRDYLDRGAVECGTEGPGSSLRAMIRLPIRSFRFPQPRGSDTPWRTPLESLAPLRTIARADLDSFDVVLLQNRRYEPPTVAKVPLGKEALQLRAQPASKGFFARRLSAWLD